MGFHCVPPNGFPDIPDIEDLEAVIEDVSDLSASVSGLEETKADTITIAPTFSAESNYAVGDLVYYEGVLYKCTTAHEAAAWDAEDFTATDVETAINSASAVKANKADIAPIFSADSNYAVGDLVYYEGVLYECTTAHEAAAWDAEDFTETTITGELNAINSKLTPLVDGLKVVVVPSGADRKIKITRSFTKQCFFVMSNNNYHPFFGIISQLDGATDHLQSVPAVSGVTASLTNDTFEITLISYFGGLTIVSSQDFTVTAEPVT